MKGLLHPAADERFAQAVRYYAEIEPVLGARFYREIDQRWLQDASRSHTGNLFGLWFLLVLRTGAYVFQEVARVHRRIDAILRLLEEEGNK